MSKFSILILAVPEGLKVKILYYKLEPENLGETVPSCGQHWGDSDN